MKLTKIKNVEVVNLANALNRVMHASRFDALVDIASRSALKIGQVRLKEKKAYCGNHPKSCEAPHPAGHRHAKRLYLEGADWVEFNDLVNGVCDRLGVSCNINTSVCEVRKGRERRTNYDADKQFGNGTWAWNKLGGPDDYMDCCGPDDYMDCCGQEDIESSTFPYGTPGIYTRINYNCVG